ncbi:hypothetical protein NC315_34740 [Streptomyces sp. G2]|uniref:hypothetical protein n=1 Tax=Streptomyces sp. G2 TaxID=1684471 RepID=UPI00202E8595|nr:hypothetical protein [Streptomyces sp. G2]MCM1950483.1 hypothetical protein [Streptomyces sp. G2]
MSPLARGRGRGEWRGWLTAGLHTIGKTHDPEVDIAAHLQDYGIDVPAVAARMAVVTTGVDRF